MQKPITVPVRKLSVYLKPFRCSSFLECALQPKIAKINKNPYFERSGSFKVIDVDTSLVLVVIGSMPMPICNLRWQSSNLFKSLTVPETRVFRAADGKDLMILACTIFDWSTRVTNKQMDERTDQIVMAKTR